MENKTGSLIITSVPTKHAGEQMLVYLQNMMKKVPMEQIEKKVAILPATLAKNISEKNGRKIASDLVQMGVIACYIDPLAPVETITEDEDPVEENRWEAFGKAIIILLNNLKEITINYFYRIKSFYNDIQKKRSI